MKKTKIDWADSTWNPVTGCLHGCEYCYARRIAERFGGYLMPIFVDYPILREPYIINGRKNPYPFDFTPTFHRYKLDEPKRWAKPRTIFVCSMADLFGEWVPDEWIQAVFEACAEAPRHRYLFLTKNPGRYCDLERKGLLPVGDNYWFGATYDHSNFQGVHMLGRPVTFSLDGKKVHDAGDWWLPGLFWKDEASAKLEPETPKRNSFISFEPLLYDIGEHIGSTGGDWLILGAETGNSKSRTPCRREWVEHITAYADKAGKPVFMKESLREIMGNDFKQEFPW